MPHQLCDGYRRRDALDVAACLVKAGHAGDHCAAFHVIRYVLGFITGLDRVELRAERAASPCVRTRIALAGCEVDLMGRPG
jgi:hypothetical protein